MGKIINITAKRGIIFCLLFFILCSLFLWRDIYLPVEPDSDKIVSFTIKKGEGAKEISVELKTEGLIRHSSIFRIYVLFGGLSQKLQAGHYELSPSMNIPDIVKKFSKGEIIKEKLTIVEGWNLKQIGQYFKDRGIANEEEFAELVKKDFSQRFAILSDKPKDLDIEGYLFPDTYEIIPGTGAEEIIKRILSNFDRKFTADLREEINRQKKSVFEIITMASLIEKEVRTLKDKKLVSGILWKRLKIGMPLQVDATINYITGKNDPAALLDDLKIDSPYNTYKYYGLPLGPIANPGLESILAAIYPEESDYLYYLSGRDGTTVFNRTYEKHNEAIIEHLR